MLIHKLRNKIFSVHTDVDFNETALEIFYYQYKNNRIYQQFVDYTHKDIKKIKNYKEIPFLPIELFKTQKVVCGNKLPDLYFESSGTTGMERSRHYVYDTELYCESFQKGFELFYGNISSYCFMALLPNYFEQKHSSLIFMINRLIKESHHPNSGFYLSDLNKIADKLKELRDSKQKTILFGVTYALLDLAEQFPIDIPDAIIFETGGMKGRRKEIIREELHLILKHAFNVKSIHGEYGMSELLSQAYSFEKGIFSTPPWMKILIRDTDDPFTLLENNLNGGINIIDFANLYSCSFIATQDLGKTYKNNTFEITGRFDNSDIRGCNLMIL